MHLCTFPYRLGLGDIEIMHCDHCSKRRCSYSYIAVKHFAVVNKANITSKFTKAIEYIGFSITVDAVHSILQYPTAIFSDILQYIAHAILLTCENACNIIIA